MEPVVVPMEPILEMSRQIGAVSSGARTLMLNFLTNVRAINGTELANASVAAMEQILSAACLQSATVAATFYDAEREMVLGSPLGAIADPRRDPAVTENAVRGICQKAMDGNRHAFETAMMERVDWEVRRGAQNCMVYNGSRDKAAPRYARVPTGPETCMFCLMLASKGFVYHSRSTAVSHQHKGCDCQVVMGFNGMASKVKGYDPNAYYNQWVESMEATARKRSERKGTSYDDEYDGIRAFWNQHRRTTDASSRSGARTNGDAASLKSVAEMANYIRGAESMEDLEQRAQMAQAAWSRTYRGQQNEQHTWIQLSQAAQSTKKKFS